MEDEAASRLVLGLGGSLVLVGEPLVGCGKHGLRELHAGFELLAVLDTHVIDEAAVERHHRSVVGAAQQDVVRAGLGSSTLQLEHDDREVGDGLGVLAERRVLCHGGHQGQREHRLLAWVGAVVAGRGRGRRTRLSSHSLTSFKVERWINQGT